MKKHSFMVKDDDGLTLAVRDMTSVPTRIVYAREYRADETDALAKDIRALMSGNARPPAEWDGNEIEFAVSDAKETFRDSHGDIERWFGADSEVSQDEGAFIMSELDNLYWQHPSVFLASMNETTLEFWGERISDEADELCQKLKEMGVSLLYYNEAVANA